MSSHLLLIDERQNPQIVIHKQQLVHHRPKKFRTRLAQVVNCHCRRPPHLSLQECFSVKSTAIELKQEQGARRDLSIVNLLNESTVMQKKKSREKNEANARQPATHLLVPQPSNAVDEHRPQIFCQDKKPVEYFQSTLPQKNILTVYQTCIGNSRKMGRRGVTRMGVDPMRVTADKQRRGVPQAPVVGELVEKAKHRAHEGVVGVDHAAHGSNGIQSGRADGASEFVEGHWEKGQGEEQAHKDGGWRVKDTTGTKFGKRVGAGKERGIRWREARLASTSCHEVFC